MNATRVQLDQLNLVSGNIEASMAFYRRLGVEIPEERVWRTATGVHHASAAENKDRAIDLDLDSSAFAQIWNRGWKGRDDLRGRVVIGFKLPSQAAVDATYADLTGAGYTGLQPPYDAFWGARYAIVEDPDGIAVGLMSPISPERRSAPPEV
ncbi:MAG TPA: VOC family protein [Alphaproteobacteria bacterium]|nr:VOC family protein [Alphaproteobacteria bacterium]